MSEKRYAVKPLVWTKPKKGCSYSSAIVTPLVACSVWKDCDLWVWSCRVGNELQGVTDLAHSLAHAKQLAEQHYRAELAKALEEVGDGE